MFISHYYRFRVFVIGDAITQYNTLVMLCLAFTGLETSNRYQIKNTLGQQIFFAGEGQCHRVYLLHFA